VVKHVRTSPMQQERVVAYRLISDITDEAAHRKTRFNDKRENSNT
jgi:hypothetical protein